jgi:hypothetical protein
MKPTRDSTPITTPAPAAEVLLDGIAAATDVRMASKAIAGTRAVQLLSRRWLYFLTLFGRSERVTPALRARGECALPQLLHLQKNSEDSSVQSPARRRLAALLKETTSQGDGATLLATVNGSHAKRSGEAHRSAGRRSARRVFATSLGVRTQGIAFNY